VIQIIFRILNIIQIVRLALIGSGFAVVCGMLSTDCCSISQVCCRHSLLTAALTPLAIWLDLTTSEQHHPPNNIIPRRVACETTMSWPLIYGATSWRSPTDKLRYVDSGQENNRVESVSLFL